MSAGGGRRGNGRSLGGGALLCPATACHCPATACCHRVLPGSPLLLSLLLPLCRENSARKEAGPLLTRYLERCRGGSAAGSGQHAAADHGEAAAAAAPEGATADAAAEGDSGACQPAALSAVKVPVRGLVALKLAAHPAPAAAGGNPATDGVDGSSGFGGSFDAGSAGTVHVMVAALLADIAAGKQARLQHVQRIVPVQTTCRLEAAALRAAGAQLAALVAAAAAGGSSNHQGEGQLERTAEAATDGTGGSKRPLTFGIGLKQREISGKPAAAAAPLAGDSSGAAASGAASAAAAAAPLDRGAIITALAGGFEQALRQRHSMEAAVDLKAPDWVLVCEVVPAGGELYAALCVLPSTLCTLKPKLHVQAVGRAGT